jgi:hypothetical protein
MSGVSDTLVMERLEGRELTYRVLASAVMISTIDLLVLFGGLKVKVLKK